VNENTSVNFNCCGKWTICEYLSYYLLKCNDFDSLCDCPEETFIIAMLSICLASLIYFEYGSVTSRCCGFFCPDITLLLFRNKRISSYNVLNAHLLWWTCCHFL